jgi:hypothetical protein
MESASFVTKNEISISSPLGKKGPKVVEVISNMTNGEGMAAECKLIILWNNDLNAKKASTRRRRRKVKKATQEGEGFGQQPTFCTVATTFESMYSSRWYGRYLRGNEEGAKHFFSRHFSLNAFSLC